MSVNLSDIPRGMTCCLSSCGLTIGGSTVAGVNIAVATHYAINGYAYLKGATDNIAMTAAPIQPVSTSCLYLVCINASGVVSSVKGKAVSTAAYLAGAAVLEWPEPANDTCPIGAVKVDTNGSTTFTAGTTAFNAGGITDTFFSLAGMPAAPMSV